MQNLTVYKCLDCGHFTISRYDGIRCAKCGRGATAPIGDATMADWKKELTVAVSIKDTDVLKNLINILGDLLCDARTPEWAKEKIMSAINEEAVDHENH